MQHHMARRVPAVPGARLRRAPVIAQEARPLLRTCAWLLVYAVVGMLGVRWGSGWSRQLV